MGFLDVLAAGVRGLGDVAATATVVRSTERAAVQASQPTQGPGPKRKLKPWEKFAGASPCARGARSDEIQKAGSDFHEIDKALRRSAAGSGGSAPKARARVKVKTR